MLTDIAPFRERLDGLVASGAELPSIPESMMEIRRLIDDDDLGELQLVDALERDVAVVGSLLKAANAAGVSMGGERVGSVAKAIRRLGLRRVRAISFAVTMMDQFGRRPRALPLDAFWAHSAAVGAVSRALAVRLLKGQVDADDIYTAGLLHDVGLLVLDQYFSADFDRVAALRSQVVSPWWEHERLVLDVTHGEIGAEILTQWSLPRSVIDAVAFHHEPECAPPAARLGAQVLRAAEYVCATDVLALHTEGLQADLCIDVLMALGVTDEEAVDLVLQLQELAISEMGALI